MSITLALVDLVIFHTFSVSNVLDILISHSQAGADFGKLFTPLVSFLLDIDFAL